MSPKADDGKQQECWECLRRRLACDGCRPVCDCCRSAGIVCPGYEDRRPLTWVTPGNVTITRFRRTRIGTTAAGAKKQKQQKQQQQKQPQLPLSPPPETTQTESESGAFAMTALADAVVESDSACIIPVDDKDEDIIIIEDDASHYFKGDDTVLSSSKMTDLTLANRRPLWSRISQRRNTISIPTDLRPQEWDIVEAIEYYNDQVFPAISSHQLSPSPFARRFDNERISDLMPANRHGVISISLGYRILALTRIHRLSINPRNAGPASPLWTAFFRHVGLAMDALGTEIRRNDARNLGNIFRSIHLIASSELFLLNSPHWRAHVSGFLSILKQYGGLSKIFGNRNFPKPVVLSFLVTCIVANTTSSRQNQIIEASELDTTDLYNLYNHSIYPPFLCPPYLFLDILHINRLRLQLPTTSSIYSVTSSPITLCDILKHIDAFSPDDWIESSNFPNQHDFLLLSRIFQSAVALYAISTLPCTSDWHAGDSCQELKLIYRNQLFQLLRLAIDSPVRIYTIYWPVVVAGVMAATGNTEERTLVEQHLNIGVHDPYSGSGSLKALAILRRFWASGMMSWDDCFKEPNVILFT